MDRGNGQTNPSASLRRSKTSAHTCTGIFQPARTPKAREGHFLADPPGTHIAGTHIAIVRWEPWWLGVLMRLSKAQFNRAIEGDAAARTEQNAAASVPSKSRHPSRIIVTALVIAVGIGAGWLGGSVLNGNSPAPAPTSDPATGDVSTPLSPASPDSHTPSNRTSEVAPSSQPTPEAEEPAVAPEPRSVEPERRAAPPKTTKVYKNDGSESPTAEDETKEIGRQALKKMSKDVKSVKRGLANKNENEDPH